jgi:LCP family protein required for cell wall assembly
MRERPPRLGLGLLRRAAVAAVLIVLTTAGAVSATVLLELDGIIEDLPVIRNPGVTRPEPGGARTILVLGSDARWGDRKAGRPVRSDTLVLLRVDPDRDAVAVLSIPRDLKVRIPGHSYADKINSAYANGGTPLTVRTVKRLFAGATGKPFAINNVINVNFGGFRRAVDYIGGVYVDVDRRYFNDNTGVERYETIDVPAGYQKLRGQDALDYVRYRHTDNDFVRAARQQDFLRQARSQDGLAKLLSDPKDLVRVFRNYFEVDDSLDSTKEVLSLLKLGVYAASKVKGMRQVDFPAREDGDYVVASKTELRRAVDELLQGKPARRPSRPRRRSRARPAAPALEDARTDGESRAILVANRLGFPFYFPNRRLAGSSYDDEKPRVYTIRDENGRPHRAYRLVLEKPGALAEYYGVQGTTWKDPPILDEPSETREAGGRRLRLFYDGRRLRLVAWRTPRAVYWVSNTLRNTLSEREMLGIAGSLRRMR